MDLFTRHLVEEEEQQREWQKYVISRATKAVCKSFDSRAAYKIHDKLKIYFNRWS